MTTELDDFLIQQFRKVYWVREGQDPPRLFATDADPVELWSRPARDLLDDVDESRFGEYIRNPDMQTVDLASARPFVPDLSALDGKVFGAVAEHVTGAHGRTRLVPGIEYWRWLVENPDRAPDVLRDGNIHCLFGSLIRGPDGYWNIPCVRWDGDEWRNEGTFLTQIWFDANRAVLLEREKPTG